MKWLRRSFLALILTCCTTVSPVQSLDASLNQSPVVDVVEPRQKQRRILIIGDSEACAINMLASHVKDAHDVVDVDCKVSTTVQYWGAQGNFRAALSRHPQPNVVIIFLGTNHYWEPHPTPDVTPILDVINELGLGCVWVGNVAVRGKQWPINSYLRNVVQPTCKYFDSENVNIQLSDGVHPTRTGAILWRTLIWKLL